MTDKNKEVVERCREFRGMFESLRQEIAKVIVGHEEIIDDVLICLFCDGHVLLEGVPGLGKTLFKAIGLYDTPVIVGTTVIFAYLLAITVLLLDFVYALVDPRVQVGGGSRAP